MANNSLGAVSQTSTTAAASAAANAGTGRQSSADMSEQFLTLLVAQMRNQDPLNPMDNAQMTSQIAQINTVSGINDLNDTLGAINGQIDTSQRLQASALIGRDVLVPGREIAVGKAGAATPFGMELPADAAQVTISISDAMGTLVHQSSYDDIPAGVQSFQWDGRDGSEQTVGEGTYRIDIQAVDSAGQAIDVQPLSMGRVGGVVAGDGAPKLDLGPRGMVPLDDIRQII
ncbi:flagellar hook assembly protein FlgD [Salinisphaera sp. T31B1]|uniref:flagellar hook assembly protein FlgD n=1 Tax=Salinisphaera sp. T31B1 TaxID=727963 RepID=UPI0033427228